MTTWIAPDFYYPPIAVASDETTIVFTEDASGTTTQASFDVTSQTYWCLHALTTTPSTSYAQLFSEIETKLENNSPNGWSYTISAAKTHEEASDTETSAREIGVKYEVSGDSFTFDFSDSAWTFPPELLGWAPDRTSDSTQNSTANGSPYSNFGRWAPTVRPEWDGAAEKPPPTARRRTVHSDEDRSRSYDLQVDPTRYRRRVTYEDVGGTAIHAPRADLDGYPALDEVADGEPNNALTEHFDRAADLSTWLVAHDNTDKQLHGELQDGTEKWELASLLEDMYDTGDIWEMTDRHPEQYSVEVAYEIRDGEYDQ